MDHHHCFPLVPMLRNIQGHIGQDSKQPDLVENVPAHSSGLGLDDL